VTELVTLVKFHLQYNVLVLYDLKYRRMYRPSSLALDSVDEVRGWTAFVGVHAVRVRSPCHASSCLGQRRPQTTSSPNPNLLQ